MTTLESVRDKLLLSLDCLSKYKRRDDACRYCEVSFPVGQSCPARELTYRMQFELATGTDNHHLDILTYASLANWKEYAGYIGEDELRAEVLSDIYKRIPGEKMGAVLKAYPFLQEK